MNLQYIKSYQDLLNSLQIITDQKVPNSPVYASLCFGWGKVRMCHNWYNLVWINWYTEKLKFSLILS